MIEITGMLISGKMSVAMFSSANGVARTISIAITMNVYGRFSASWTIDIEGGSRRRPAAPPGGLRGETAMIFRVPRRRRRSLTSGCRLVPHPPRAGWPNVRDRSDTSLPGLPNSREHHGHDHRLCTALGDGCRERDRIDDDHRAEAARAG